MMEDFSRQIRRIASTYGTNTIFILGKGPSVDKIPPEVYAGSLVIGVNDAERIYPADITIFHADWVKQALTDSGARAQLYLTSTDFAPEGGVVLRAPHLPLRQETADLMMQRLFSEEFVIEDILFISALRVALELARLRGRTQRVYMVGFDFLPELGYAQVNGVHYETGGDERRALIIGMQENFFLNALYMLHGTSLDIFHVGKRSYSRLSVDEFVSEFHPPQGNLTKSSWQTLVVAEITTNHFGDRGRLERIVRAASAAGADYVKVQKRHVETFYSREQLCAPYRSPFGQTFGDYRRHLELSADDFEFLDQICRRLGISWFASVLDMHSYHFIQDFAPALIKLPSTISEHKDYLKYVADTCKQDIVLSTGMTDVAYERWILHTFTKSPKIYLMQANSAYPTPAHDCNIGVIRHYARLSQENPKIVPAYSSHDAGWFASTLAVAAGARMLEKHVKLGNTEWAHFDAVALDLTTSDFKEYVNKIRESELVVGSEEKTVAASEYHKYRIAQQASRERQ